MIHLERIRELCEKAGVTMKQAASDLGMTEMGLQKIIKSNSTKIETLLAIAEYFKVEPVYFFESSSKEMGDCLQIEKEELYGLFKKVLAYSILGFGLIKLDWNEKERLFYSYFDVLSKPYNPDIADIEYLSSFMETKIDVTEKTVSTDVAKLLLPKDEFDYMSSFYSNIREKQLQEELFKLKLFLAKHKIPLTEAIRAEISEKEAQIRYYGSKSIIGANK